MNIAPIPSAAASDIPIAELAVNKHLTERQKIAEASRQFEVIMLQQILAETQKPVITSEFTDDSTAAGIYQDYISHALAESMSKTDAFGFAKMFEQQLVPHTAKAAKTDSAAQPLENPSAKNVNSLSATRP
jgi:Rod binding domain-containing protein